MRQIKQLAALSAAMLGFGITTPAKALDLTNIPNAPVGFTSPYATYGDANSYSLPVLGAFYNLFNGSGFTNSIQPGNPYYVASSPGAIQDLIVVGTGANGGPVNTNFAGMDNAYPTPNDQKGTVFFSTNKTAYGGSCTGCSLPSDPSQVGGPFTGDTSNTWDIRLSALHNFVGSESPIFFFNNNQVNSGDATNQSLAAWAGLTLIDDSGTLQPLHLYFSNQDGKYALISEGGGGVLNGTAGSGTTAPFTGPVAGNNNNTDYVLSGGALCYDATFSAVSCSDPNAVGGPINHNLGANQAAYAVVFPKLNEILGLGGADPFGGYDVLNIDWRMGCDPNTEAGSCIGRSINNGYEQLFIGTGSTVVNVPEPGTLALLGSALLGFGAMRRRRTI